MERRKALGLFAATAASFTALPSLGAGTSLAEDVTGQGKGGYTFARQPSSITVLEVVELLDGPVGAGAEGVFAEAAAAARKVLEETTIADVVERERQNAGAAMYYI